jgi:subfamily B ATP-binding cassette protein MsbA
MGCQRDLLDPAIKYLFLDKNADMLLIIPLGIMGVMLFKAAASYGAGVYLNHVGLRAVGDLQSAMFGALMRFDLAQLNAIHSGQFASNFLNDAAMLRETIVRSIQGLARDIVTLTGLGAVMYYQDWRLALAATTEPRRTSPNGGSRPRISTTCGRLATKARQSMCTVAR